MSNDPSDESQKRLADRYPGYRFFWDFDCSVAKLYGAMPLNQMDNKFTDMQRMWIVLDPTLRILKIIPFIHDQSDINLLINYLEDLVPPNKFAGCELQAPIIMLPNVFDPELCRELIKLYEDNGGEDSGFMRQIGGKTVGILNRDFKSRHDFIIENKNLIERLQRRVKSCIN